MPCEFLPNLFTIGMRATTSEGPRNNQKYCVLRAVPLTKFNPNSRVFVPLMPHFSLISVIMPIMGVIDSVGCYFCVHFLLLGRYLECSVVMRYVVIFAQNAAKQAAAAATQTIAAAQNAAASNKNPMSHQQLVFSCKVLLVNILFEKF